MDTSFVDTTLLVFKMFITLAGIALVVDFFWERRIYTNLTNLYYRKKEPFDEKNADLIVAKTGMQREFIKALYKISRRNPSMQGENCVSCSLSLNRGEVQQMMLLVFKFGYSINSVSMPEGTHEYKRTEHTFVIENR